MNAQLLNHLIGFDTLLNRLSSMDNTGYPPFNLIKEDDDHYTIEMAVAGFSQDEIDITLKDGWLIINGEPKVIPEVSYIHRGIARRQFGRRFSLAEHIQIVNASLADGMLTISLKREVPEEKKPKKIPINKTKNMLLG